MQYFGGYQIVKGGIAIYRIHIILWVQDTGAMTQHMNFM